MHLLISLKYLHLDLNQKGVLLMADVLKPVASPRACEQIKMPKNMHLLSFIHTSKATCRTLNKTLEIITFEVVRSE